MPIKMEDRYKLAIEEHRWASEVRLKIIQMWFLIYAGLSASFGWFQSNSQRQEISWIITAFGMLVTILFWIGDIRNRNGLRRSREVAIAIEQDPRANIPPNQRLYQKIPPKLFLKIFPLSHGFAIDVFSILILLALAIATYFLFHSEGLLPR